MVRTAGGGTLPRATVMSVVNRLDPSVAMTDFATLDEIVSQTLFRERMLAGLSLAFTGLSALLAAMGLFGLTSFSVVRRTREIGIRLALSVVALMAVAAVAGLLPARRASRLDPAVTLRWE